MSTPILLPAQALDVKYQASWRVVLPMPVYTELMHYVDKFPGECSGAGLVDLVVNDKEQVFTIERVFLPAEQKNTGASTDIEPEAVGKLVTQLVRDGASPEKLRCHWHSHASMSVFHSGTDEDNYKVLKTGEWLVSLVLNKAGEVKASVHYYKPFIMNAVNIPVTVMLDSVEHKPEWDAAVAAVEAYEASKKPKVGVFHDWRKDTDTHRTEGYKGGQRKWVEDGKIAVQMLSDMLLSMEGAMYPTEQITQRWDEATCDVVDVMSNRLLRLSLQVEDVREAIPADFDLANLKGEA